MSYEGIARRWARAVFAIGKEQNNVPALTRDVQSFAEAYSSSDELRAALENPLVPDASCEAIVREIAGRLGLSEVATNTLRLLTRKGRMRALPDIAKQLSRLADEDAGVVRAEVTSAGDLSPAYLDKLRGELEKSTGKKVIIAQRKDPSLLGGVVTKIGDNIIDGSVRARLANFRELLLRT